MFADKEIFVDLQTGTISLVLRQESEDVGELAVVLEAVVPDDPYAPEE